MDTEPNLRDYREEYRTFAIEVPERFSFPLDVFDRRTSGSALFWTDGSNERTYSFPELSERSSKAAGFFRAIGIRKGDRVLVILPNLAEWWEIMLGLMRLNAVPIPATTILSVKDVAFRLEAAGISAVIAAADQTGKVDEAAGLSGRSMLRVVAGSREGWTAYEAGRNAADAFPGEQARSDETGLIYFTSGTTGPPKMVVHTQTSYPLAHLVTGKFWLDLRPGDLHWNLSDTGWAKASWSSLFGPWHCGAAVFSYYHPGKFDPGLVLSVLRRFPVTTFCGPPTAYRMMVKEVTGSDAFRFAALRHCVAAGEPLNPEVIAAWQERTGLFIHDGYGQTETVNLLANFRSVEQRPGSMGLPVPGYDVAVIGDNGAPLPAGVEGDIAVRISPERPVGLFKEYLDNPEATGKTVRGDWYVTGDRAFRDSEGFFWFVGRADDVILTSGYRIGPFEVESILIRHPAVKESAVVASPDPVRGEVVKAFIVLTEAYSPSDALAQELQAFVKGQTAPYKYPRKIAFVGDLPKTVSGKIRRKELKLREFGKREAGPDGQ